MGLARGQADCVMLASAGEGSPAPNPARPREFPFWLTRFPTSKSYPAIAGRTLRTRLGWVAAEVELHGILMPTPAVRLRWPFRSALGATANRLSLPQVKPQWPLRIADASLLAAGRSTGRLRSGGCWGGADNTYVLAAKLRWPPGRLHAHGPDIVNLLSKEELVSLEWVSAGTRCMVIPAAHIENLLATGYVEESLSGLALTDLGVWRLNRGREEGTDVALRVPRAPSRSSLRPNSRWR